MSENYRVEAEVVHDLPDEIVAGIGRIVVGTSKLEHKLTTMIGLILQIDKAEMRLTLREPRLPERLDIIHELFLLKALEPDFDFDGFRKSLEDISNRRHRVAHGLWLQVPNTGELYLRLARGSWPKNMLIKGNAGRLRRDVLPQSIPHGPKELQEDLALINSALETLDELGALLDHSLATYPERFRQPLAPINPLGGHRPKKL